MKQKSILFEVLDSMDAWQTVFHVDISMVFSLVLSFAQMVSLYAVHLSWSELSNKGVGSVCM